MDFNRETKIVLAHSTNIAEKVAVELTNNGFVDGPHNVRKLLPLNTEQRVNDMLATLKALRGAIFSRSNSASGMSAGEIVCLSYISELYGVLESRFVLLNEPDNMDTLFPPTETKQADRFSLLDLDQN